MHSSLRWLTVAAAAFLLVAPAGAQRIKVTTQTVPLYVTVTDAEKRLVPDLTKEDFEVYDNAKLQTLTNFDNQPTPITVVVMLDTSGSMTLALDLVKDGAEAVPDADAADRQGHGRRVQRQDRVPSRDRSPTTAISWSRALKELDFGYPTRLYDAIDQSIDQLNGAEGRKTVLVFTDGDDNASRRGAGDGHRAGAARRSDDVLDRPRERVLQRPAEGAQQPGSQPAASCRRRPAAASSC